MVRKESSPKLGGEGRSGVEVDEMYHGGRRKNESGRVLGGDAANKTMVMGVVERKGGGIVARIAPRLTMLLLAAYWPVGYLAVTEIGGAGITGLVRFSIGKIRAEELKLSCIRRLSRVTRRDPSCS